MDDKKIFRGIEVLKPTEKLVLLMPPDMTEEEFHHVSERLSDTNAKILIVASQCKAFIVPRRGEIELRKG